MDNDKFTVLDLTKDDAQFEIASFNDSDLMRIICYATHEGRNLNGAIFPPKVLVNCYRTFVDKPVVIVPDEFSNPTGHGFDYEKQKFDNSKRIQIGHVVNAYPAFVQEDGNVFSIYDAQELDQFNDVEGELRIVAELAIYKHYFEGIADRLKLLHEIGNLNFSMEAVVSAVDTNDGGRVCTDIRFTGLAIVDNPAFVRSHSIEVASKKEDGNMEYKELYEAEKAKNDTLVAEKAVVDGELETVKSELASVKEELANSKAEVADVKAEVEALKPYKEKVEAAEKEALGKERAEKLAKFGVKDVDTKELAELSKDAFADKLVEAAENYEVVISESHEGAMGIPQHDTGMKSNKSKLLEILGNM